MRSRTSRIMAILAIVGLNAGVDFHQELNRRSRSRMQEAR